MCAEGVGDRLEAVVVGGGLAGVAVALALREAGALVTVVDAERPGAGATGAAAGMLAHQHETRSSEEPLFALKVEARRAWPAFARRLEKLAGRPVPVETSGALRVHRAADEEGDSKAVVRAQRARGLEARMVDADEARRLEPALAAGVCSAAWFPDEAWVDVQKVAEALGDVLEAAGARALAGVRVRGVRTRNGRAAGVELEERGGLEADAVVLATGAELNRLRGLPGPVPVRPVRGELLRYRPYPDAPRRIVADTRGRYLVPRADGGVVAGSTMDEAGFDRSITDEGRRRIEGGVRELVSGLPPGSPAGHWAGLRPLTPDGGPVLGPYPEVENLFVASGYGRNGILLAPLCGRIVAACVLGREPPVDWRPFDPGRFR